MDADDALTRLNLMASVKPEEIAALLRSEPYLKQLQGDLRLVLPRQLKGKPDEEMRKYLDGVVGVVEATRCEQSMLWELNDRSKRREWASNAFGLSETVGLIGGLPVHVSLMTAVVGGCKLLFVEPTSRAVDHDMVRAWLDRSLPASARREDGRLNITDATNFHNVFPHPARTAA